MHVDPVDSWSHGILYHSGHSGVPVSQILDRPNAQVPIDVYGSDDEGIDGYEEDFDGYDEDLDRMDVVYLIHMSFDR